MAFKFIHMADVHLDTPFQSRDESLRHMLKDSIKQALKASVDMALAEKVHAILIAGDLFDGDTLSFSSEKFLLEQAERLNEASIEVFYASGNHDPSGSLKNHRTGILPSNVHIFHSHDVKSIPVFDGNGEKVGVVCGAGHENRMEGRNLASLFPQGGCDVPHVGLLHAFVTSSKSCENHDRYAPCSISDLKDKGYSYWALGHIHTREEILDYPHIVYPGNLMGRNPNETGQKGVYLVEIKSSDSTEARFVPVPSVTWENAVIGDLSKVTSLHGLEDVICSNVAGMMEQGNLKGGRMMVRAVLKGPCPIYDELYDDNIRELEETVASSLLLAHLEIITDGITRPVKPEIYRDQPHVLSAFLSLIDKLGQDDELLLKLADKELAGMNNASLRDEKLRYLRSFLHEMDYEGVSRLLKEGDHEI